jgi:hypothetical protein
VNQAEAHGNTRPRFLVRSWSNHAPRDTDESAQSGYKRRAFTPCHQPVAMEDFMDKVSCQDDVLDQSAIADYFGVSTRTIRNWVRKSWLLPPVVIGRRRYWPRTVFSAWLNDRAQQPLPFRAVAPEPSVRRLGRPRQPT